MKHINQFLISYKFANFVQLMKILAKKQQIDTKSKKHSITKGSIIK